MNFRLKQIKHDCDIWDRKLRYITEENICFKMRLTEILKEYTLEIDINAIEFNQNLIVELDEIIRITKIQLKEIFTLIEFDSIDYIDSIDLKINLIKKQIDIIKYRFYILDQKISEFITTTLASI